MVTMETISKQLADKQFITYHFGNHFSTMQVFKMLPSNRYYGNCYQATY